MNVAGLSIGETLVRVSIVKKRLRAATRLHTEELILPDDREEKAAALREALLRWKQDYGIRGIVVGLDLRHFSHHFVELPVTSPTDIRHALAFELEKHLPLLPEEYIYDFHTLKAGEAGSRNLVLALRKDRMDWIVRGLEDTGLKLLAVRCSAMEALNEFMSTVSADEVVFIHPGERSHYMLGLRNSAPSEIRALKAGEDAAAGLGEFASGYGRGVYASGPTGLGASGGPEVTELSYSIPDILVLSTTGTRPVDMDFTPAELRPLRLNYYRYAVIALAAASVILFFSNSVLSYYRDYSALKDVQARIAEIQSTSRDLVELKKEMEEIDRKRQFLYAFKLKRNRQIEILKQMSIILPSDAWLTGFSSGEKGKVEIDGYAKRSADIIAPLENSPYFKNVEFSSPVTVREGKERFSIRMEVEQ